MAKEFTRAQRVAELIHHKLASIIQQEIPAHEFGMITVTTVTVCPSLELAKVYITIFDETPEKIKDVLALLERNNKYLRHLLVKQVALRIAPELKFYYDLAQQHARKLSGLIHEAVESDKKLQTGDESDESN